MASSPGSPEGKEDVRLAEMQRDYAEQLEDKDRELDRACALLLSIEGAILGYWTDIPPHVLSKYQLEIRAFLGAWEPKFDTPDVFNEGPNADADTVATYGE